MEEVAENNTAQPKEKPSAKVGPFNFIPYETATGEILFVGQYIKLPNDYEDQSPKKGVKSRKRTKIAFTDAHEYKLETEFLKSPLLDKARREYLSKCLNLTERTLKIWFLNRRKKAT
ncbi:homeobox protein Hox-B8-like [Ostrinia nubilalis]|uniref:homeobox protein Hox-B8-like n=1 Tax=Ostrinia furnacalis TaxID=93504 RepID=UPI00103FE38C|nr:homeobox protein Hox-B8-like [Ostrinia furnacalis]XP_028157601.1 homeobox protein Hox-B8-like [Ostrinia furnacalis]